MVISVQESLEVGEQCTKLGSGWGEIQCRTYILLWVSFVTKRILSRVLGKSHVLGQSLETQCILYYLLIQDFRHVAHPPVQFSSISSKVTVSRDEASGSIER